MPNYPILLPAIRVKQPLGVFYAASIPVGVLLATTYSEKVRALPTVDGTYYVDGAQRLQDPKRLDAIAKFINREDSAFPNSIILAPNYREDGRIEGDSDDEATEVEEELRRWSIEVEPTPPGVGDVPVKYWLRIPSPEKIAAVIDGQHRLFAFAKADVAHLDDELLCAVYLDLPKPLQAQIFATINSTQKPVSKNLTYELFGYNVEMSLRRIGPRKSLPCS